MVGKIEKTFYVLNNTEVKVASGYQDANQQALTMIQQGKKDVMGLLVYGEPADWLKEMLKTSKGEINNGNG